MTKLRFMLRVLSVTLALPLALAVSFPVLAATDPALLGMVMPDAKVVAGLQVDAARNSLFGQYVLTHMQPNDPNFVQFVTATGFDPRRDISQLVIASDWSGSSSTPGWLVLAKGSFDPVKITSLVQSKGGTVTMFQGVAILSTAQAPAKAAQPAGIAFLNTSTAVIGELGSVEAAIQRNQTNATASSALLSAANTASANNDFWFATLVPLSEFASAMPNANLQGALQGNLLQAILQASGGVKFSEPVLISIQATTRSDKDAQALQDVVRFLAGLLQQNQNSNATASEFASALTNLNVATNGSVLTLSVPIPESELEQIFDFATQPRPQTRKRTPQVQ